MSILSEIERIRSNIAGAYTAAEEKGGTIPEMRDSAHLAETVRSIPDIPASVPPAVPLDPAEVYQKTRPADWLPMPQPQDDEMYLLFHIPDGVSSLLAFTVTCTGNYTVELGTAADGQFSPRTAVSLASGGKYEAELSADDFDSLTSTGMKQCMIRVSGTGILTWTPSTHKKKTSPSNFAGWNIVEIVCRLPAGTKVACGNNSANLALKALRYFSWFGGNHVTSMSNMFSACYSLLAVPQLDTAGAASMSNMFNACYSLLAIPQMDTRKVTNMGTMFRTCYSLRAIPEMDTGKVTSMSSMFNACYALAAVPQMDTGNVANMGSMFNSCYALAVVPRMDTGKVTSTSNMFASCYSLARFTLNPLLTGWAGCDISFNACSLGHDALVELFNSLPIVTVTKTITLTGNPGVSELTDGEKQIAADKNWTLK